MFLATVLWLCPAQAQQPSAQSPSKPLTAVAPVYTPIAVLANVSGDVSVEVTIASDGTVRSTSALDGNKLLIHGALEAAKRWRFESGASNRKVVLKFSFRVY
jgi:TonB family protein